MRRGIRAGPRAGRIAPRAALAVLAATILPGCGAPPPADRILVNARIWTGWEERPEAEAIALRGDRIAAVGGEAEVRRLADPSTRVEDLGGRRVVPGFIDCHVHFLDGGRYLLGVDLHGAASEKELAAQLGEYAARLPAGRWILNGNWDHERWSPARLPSRASIDPLTEDHPVYVSRLDGHMALANSLALSLAGIRGDTPDPPGGTIDRDPRTGEPTGILRDAAMGLLDAVVPDSTPEQDDEALAAALTHAAALGVTSVHHMTGASRGVRTFADLESLRRFHARGDLTLRVYAITPLPLWLELRDEVERRGRGDAWLHIGGLKGFMDGSLGSNTAYFFEPYLDRPDTRGLMGPELFPAGAMVERILGADAAGLQITVHAIGDQANDMLLGYFAETALRNRPHPRRPRVEHAQHLRAADIPRFGRDGVIPSMQPYHAIDDGRWAEKRIGHERCRATYAFRALLDSGARLAFGSDWPVAPLDPLMGIYAAATRRTLDGRNPDGWIPEQKISVAEALRAYTRDAAYAEMAEQDKGILRPGQLADLVVLSRDILAMPPEEIPQARVERTIVGGRTVYSSNADDSDPADAGLPQGGGD
jgi:hypothetical protein